MFFLYNGLLLLPRLACGPVGLWATYSDGESAQEWAGRLGRVPGSTGPRAIWIQAASVGETRVAAALLRSFPKGLSPTYLSATTRAGCRLARSLEAEFGGTLATGTFPLDFRASVRATLDVLRPRVLVLVETEVWPNLLDACAATGVRTLIVNGRISPRAFARYRLAPRLTRRCLGLVGRICAQSEADAQRFIALGSPRERVEVAGNIKYDTPPPPSREAASEFRAGVGVPADAPLFVAGSTAEGEDALVLDAFTILRRARPALRLLLAPRHARRFDEAAHEATRRGFRVGRRSEPAAPGEAPEVIILDTLGELPLAWAAAQAAFVGGSLVPRGGQNMIEPASCGLPPVFGPGVENFREPADRLLGAGAAFVVNDPRELAAAIGALLDDPARSRSLGEIARLTVAAASGATARCREAIEASLRAGAFRKGAA